MGWVVSRIPIDVNEHGMTPEESNGDLLEIHTGGWEPIGWDPVGQWVIIRRKETFRERLARWLAPRRDEPASPQETARHPTGDGGVSEWTPQDTRDILAQAQ